MLQGAVNRVRGWHEAGIITALLDVRLAKRSGLFGAQRESPLVTPRRGSATSERGLI